MKTTDQSGVRSDTCCHLSVVAWNPVSETVPDGVEVLIATDGGEVALAHIARDRAGNPFWTDWHSMWETRCVTHWANKPTAPQRPTTTECSPIPATVYDGGGRVIEQLNTEQIRAALRKIMAEYDKAQREMWRMSTEKLAASSNQVPWNEFDSGETLNGQKLAVFVYPLGGKPCVGLKIEERLWWTVTAIYATRMDTGEWNIPECVAREARIILRVIDAADAFEAEWLKKRTPTTPAPDGWEWMQFANTRAHYLRRTPGGSIVSMPTDASACSAYLAVVAEWKARNR